VSEDEPARGYLAAALERDVGFRQCPAESEGIVGALLGGFIAGALFDVDPLDEFFDISTWLTAIVGSIILLVIYRLTVSRRDGRVRA
jgi:fructose-specific phosphotransferase system IIC component